MPEPRKPTRDEVTVARLRLLMDSTWLSEEVTEAAREGLRLIAKLRREARDKTVRIEHLEEVVRVWRAKGGAS